MEKKKRHKERECHNRTETDEAQSANKNKETTMLGR